MAEAISFLDFWISQTEADHAERTPIERCNYWLGEILSAEAECRTAISEGDFTYLDDMAGALEYLAAELKKAATDIVKTGKPNGDWIVF